jgi:hypothetical protein
MRQFQSRSLFFLPVQDRSFMLSKAQQVHVCLSMTRTLPELCNACHRRATAPTWAPWAPITPFPCAPIRGFAQQVPALGNFSSLPFYGGRHEWLPALRPFCHGVGARGSKLQDNQTKCCCVDQDCVQNGCVCTQNQCVFSLAVSAGIEARLKPSVLESPGSAHH